MSFFKTPSEWLPATAALLSIALMGAAFALMLLRFVRLLRGAEPAARLSRKGPGGRALVLAALAMLLSRLLLYAAAWGVHCLMQGRAVSFAASFDGLWVHWDARHYLKIAQQGYVNVGDDRLILVFFPLYPWCVRALNLLLGDWVVSSVIVSNLCAAGAASLLYALVHRVYDAQTARLSLCYFLLNPYSVFLAAPYSEALFLLLTLGALYAAANDRLLAAALLGALSALTRSLGVVVCGVIWLYAWRKALRARKGTRAALALRGTLTGLLVFLGLGAYLYLNYTVSGNPFQFLIYQRDNWYQQMGTFFGSVRNTTDYIFRSWGESDCFWTWGVQLFSIFYAMILLVFTGRRMPLEHQAYTVVYIAVALAPTWLLSGPRYLMAMATMPILQAITTRRRAPHALLLSLQGVLLLFFTVGYTIFVEVL